jgi:hypothetical protein
MRFIKSALLLGLVMSAAAAGYTTVRHPWWALGLAILSTAGFWLAAWQVQRRFGTSSSHDVGEYPDAPDAVLFDHALKSRRDAVHGDFEVPYARGQGSGQMPASTGRERPAA